MVINVYVLFYFQFDRQNDKLLITRPLNRNSLTFPRVSPSVVVSQTRESDQEKVTTGISFVINAVIRRAESLWIISPLNIHCLGSCRRLLWSYTIIFLGKAAPLETWCWNMCFTWYWSFTVSGSWEREVRIPDKWKTEEFITQGSMNFPLML